jgi:putative transposase
MLRAVWFDASAWLVGRYVIMPDHIHMFAAPGAMNIEYDTWVTYWKRLLALKHGRPEWRFQTDHWDRRLRSSESYSQKWEYVRNNPVRHGLVRDTDDWLFQGELNELQWYE